MARARELFLSSSGLGQRGVGHIEVSDMDVLDSEVSDIGVLESEVGHAALLAAQPERKECGALVSDTQVSDIEVLDNVSNSVVRSRTCCFSAVARRMGHWVGGSQLM